jgi:single-strand DNA-binding protein
MNVNKVFLGGRLTRDPELRYTASGTSLCSFGIAVNRVWYDKGSGTKKEETCFVDCTAWAKTAENIAKFFKKGREIFVEGRLKLDEWTDKTSGSRRSKLQVVVDSFDFVGGKRDEEPVAAAQEPKDRPY